MQTKTPVLNEEIYYWIYIINPSKRRRLMSMRVRYGTPAMCITMALPDVHECSFWDPCDVHGHGLARAERVHSNVLCRSGK